MNNQIVEISGEELDLVSGGGLEDVAEGFKNFGKGLVKPFGLFPKDEKLWGPENILNFSLKNKHCDGDFSILSALGTAVTTTVTVSGLLAAGMASGATVMYFVKDKVKSLLSK